MCVCSTVSALAFFLAFRCFRLSPACFAHIQLGGPERRIQIILYLFPLVCTRTWKCRATASFFSRTIRSECFCPVASFSRRSPSTLYIYAKPQSDPFCTLSGPIARPCHSVFHSYHHLPAPVMFHVHFFFFGSSHW